MNKSYEIDDKEHFKIFEENKRRYNEGEELVDEYEFLDFLKKFDLNESGGSLYYVPEDVDVFDGYNFCESQEYIGRWYEFDITFFKIGRLYLGRFYYGDDYFASGNGAIEVFLYVGNGVFEVYEVSAKDIKYVK